MEPKTEVYVPESARKDKGHKHNWKWLRESNIEPAIFSRVYCGHLDEDGECQKYLTLDEVLRRLNALEDMLTWDNGLYTGTQMRDFARIVCDPASIGS